MTSTVSYQSVNGPLALAPLTGGLADCRLAGTSFRQAQQTACQTAGLSLVAEGGDLVILANAWITAAGLRRLCEAEAPCVALADGEVVAYRGSPEGTPVSMDTSEAVLVRYPWDLLAVQESLLTEEAVSESIEGDVHPQAVIDGVLRLGQGSR